MAVVLWTQAQWARRRWREVHGWAKQTITYCSSACNRYNGMNRLTELCRLSLIQTPPHGERQGARRHCKPIVPAGGGEQRIDRKKKTQKENQGANKNLAGP